MDNERAYCERTELSVRMIDGSLLPGMRQVKLKDQLLTSKLLTVVSELVETMADALSEDRETARDCVRYASAALLSCAREADEPADAERGKSTAPGVLRSGLAPWQVRRLSTYIDANLNSSVSCETLAHLAGLSVSHFARAFKYTFGHSPHVFLMRRRVERAQGLMLKSDVPLAQIASECGYADQAHFSRSFLQFTGESPRSWRRARASEGGLGTPEESAVDHGIRRSGSGRLFERRCDY
jgi:AraC family transcriptional regulator